MKVRTLWRLSMTLALLALAVAPSLARPQAPPPPPVLAPIQNPGGSGNYTVDWSDSAGATYYTLQEDDHAGFSSPTDCYSGPDSEYQFPSHAAGTWYYRVQASSTDGDSDWSNVESTSVKPAPPTLYSIDNEDGDGDYTVAWGPSTGATGYTLQEADNSAFAGPTTLWTGPQTEYLVRGHAPGTFYYRVKATNAGGDSPWSTIQSTSIKPAAPELLHIENQDGDGSYLVDWRETAGATSYTLQEADNPSFDPAAVRYIGSGTEFPVTGRSAGTWYYRVRASNAGGDGPWSNVEQVSVRPSAPRLWAIDNAGGAGSYLVDWSDVAGATRYELEEDKAPDFGSATRPYLGSASQYAVSDQPGGRWYYRVRAANAGGASPWSNVESTLVRPAAPNLKLITNSDGDGDYLVAWDAAAGATSYTLEEDTSTAFTHPIRVYEGAATQHAVEGRPAGMWYYRVLAANEAGSSPWSNIRGVSVWPDAPVLSPIDNADGDPHYLVAWGSVGGADRYLLQEADNVGFSSPVVRYEGPAASFAINDQPAGTWYYRVRAANAGGQSPWSNVRSASVRPDAPALSSIDNPGGGASYRIEWNSVPGALTYTLQESGNPAFSSPVVRYSGAGSSFVASDQAAGTWYYRVKASNAGGDSPWSNVQSTSVRPAAPVLAPIDNPDGSGDYVVTWNQVEGATRYRLEQDGDSAFPNPTAVYSGTATVHALTGQAAGTWYYRVKAGNAGGDSPWSNVETTSVKPGAPTLLPISNDDKDGDYGVTWQPVAGAEAYRLQETRDPLFAEATIRYTGPATELVVEGQTQGVWYYRVQARNVAGDGPWSGTQTTMVVSRYFLPNVVRNWPPLPKVPALQPIANADGDGAYTIRWNAADHASGYTLQESADGRFASPREVYAGPETRYEVSGQTTGRFYYRVQARNDWGTSAWSESRWVDVAWEKEPNDRAEDANGPLVSGVTYHGTFPDEADEVDYYYIQVATASLVELWLDHIPGGHDFDVYLRDANLAVKAKSDRAGNADEYLRAELPPGRYYIQVYRRSGPGSPQPYHLRVTYP
jgi:hypothetical protein